MGMSLEPDTSVPKLLALVRSNAPTSEDALTMLGLLIEKSVRGRGATPSYFQVLDEILGPATAARDLTPAEVETAMLGLLELLADGQRSQRMEVVWALAKSLDERIVGPLTSTLMASLHDPGAERLVEQIVGALSAIEGAETDAALRRVAEEGSGDAKAAATNVLAVRSRLRDWREAH